MPDWTHEQKSAIDVRDSNVLVAAAAGAGKTAVLVERIIGRITDEKNPVDIDKLLIVTFTNAAAAEMRERIGASLSKKLEENPQNKRLQNQITLLNKASITTIHSFCLEVIRNNFYVIDLDPSFRIGDDTEALLLKNETIEELFDEKYEQNTEEFLNLVECYGGTRDDASLKDMVLSLYEFSQSTPEPKTWLREMADMLWIGEGFDFDNTPWARILKDNIKVELTGLISMMESAINMADDPNLEPYKSHFHEEVVKLKNLLSCCENSWDNLYRGFSSMEFDKLPRCKNPDKSTQDAMKNIRDGVKKRIDTIKEDVLIGDSNTIGNEMAKLYPIIKSLTELVIEFEDRFRQKKREKGIIDFNDIEHYCIDILLNRDENGNVVPSKAAMGYREKFEEIFIDEYQDSNLVQELILTTISRIQENRPNMFMVGDVKQSIYRFRQAKPEIFLYKYSTYRDDGPERKILLYKNFRSRKAVIDATNYIFKAIMSKNIGEIEYDDNEALNAGAAYPPPKDENIVNYGGAVELHIIETQKSEQISENEEDSSEEEEDLDSVQLEARMAGKRILELIGGENPMYVLDPNYENPDIPPELKAPEAKKDPEKSEEILKYKYRKLQYRDIVILMRATSSTAPIYLEELKNMGIPIFADTGSGYFEQLEVKVMLSLLQIIDNPMQDIPLVSVLRSPIGSFSDDELVDIRMVDGENFYDSLRAKGQDEDVLGLKVRAFLDRLHTWRKKSLHMAISEFIWYLYMETGYFACCGAMPGGVQRQANLRVLFERARQYEETSYKGLFNFINFINKLKKGSGDMGSAKILGENENVVRIMSIHKSKGLEFPVVFVCGMGRRFNLMDLKNSILFHHELGLGPDFVDPRRRITYPTIVKQALRRKIKLESFSEEMRILYVAFTRAKERLIITGAVSDMEKACKRWAVSKEGIKVPEYKIINGTTFLDWIGPALICHRDCRELRTLAGMDEAHIIDDESNWNVKIWKRAEIIKDGVNVNEEFGGEIGLVQQDIDENPYYEEVSRRLSYKYPYTKSSNMPAKLSVTELKRRSGTALEDEYTQKIFIPTLLSTPSFMAGEREISAPERGTIMHLVMQHIDFKKHYTPEDLNDLLSKMVEEEFLTEEEVSSVDRERIIKFLKSPIADRMRKAKGLYREIPFFTEIKGCEVYKDLEDKDPCKDDTILLQGIIDCCFEEDDGLVLVDYKTDYYKEVKEMKGKYEVQLRYYALALERMMGKAVKEQYLYLFYRGETLRLE